MNWKNLYKSLSQRTGVPEKTVRNVISSYWDGVKEELLKNLSLKISKWGSFKVKELKPYSGVNRLKGEKKEYFKPTRRKLVFKLSKKYKEYLMRKS